MNTARPLMIFSGSSSSEYGLAIPRCDAFEGSFFDYSSDIFRHHAMLSGVTPSGRDAIPLMFIKTRPSVRQSSGTSQGLGSEAAKRKYAELATQLEQLDLAGDDVVEHGAVETAAAVIKQFSRTDLAPPELSWMGSDAIVMLWMLGNTKYALTITDGEVGYVVRADGKTLRRDHDIPLENLDTLRLS